MKIKKIFKSISKALLFVTILLILLYLPSFMFRPDYMAEHDFDLGRNEAIIKISKEAPDTIDVLVMGDSLSYTSVSPMQIWEEYGYTVFDAGGSGQKISETYDTLKVALEKQHPKIVLLETNAIFRKENDGRDEVSALSGRLYDACPLLKYHNVWKTPFVRRTGRDYKGYHVNTSVRPYDGGEYLEKTDECMTIATENMRAFKKVKELCDENGIMLILYSAPSPRCYNTKKINAVKALASAEACEYLDLNQEVENLGINWAKDTRDKGDHLNSFGTRKTTDYIGKYLHSLGVLKDRSNDEKLSDWHEIYAQYKKAEKKKGF